ncbi:Gamma-glutamylcyclotransferase [Gracilaria domingensis]|nr:Gamma-glutamylcyclotransferase [Gracilaria domingensis]
MRTRGVARKESEPLEIEFTDVWVGRLKDWQLCMNIRGSPPSEPAFGNIRSCKGDEVYGVVYRMKTEASWEKLKRSEGVRDPPSKTGYLVIEVSVECFSPDSSSLKTVRAVNTLVSFDNGILPRRLEALVLPSSRYMKLLTSGAREEGLPLSYVERLELMPVARVWDGSILPEMGLLLTVLYFNLARVRMSQVVAPFRISVLYLYGLHETFARKESKKPFDRLGMALCKMAMFCVYLIPNLATFLLFVVKRQSWERYRTFRRRRIASNTADTLTRAKTS